MTAEGLLEQLQKSQLPKEPEKSKSKGKGFGRIISFIMYFIVVVFVFEAIFRRIILYSLLYTDLGKTLNWHAVTPPTLSAFDYCAEVLSIYWKNIFNPTDAPMYVPSYLYYRPEYMSFWSL